MKKEFSFSSADGITVSYGTIWAPEGEVKCVLQISHGMQEFIDRYDDFANYLNEQGIAVIGNDHLGHGRSVTSEDEWGYVANKDGGKLLIRDLKQVTDIAKKEFPGAPLILLGHSMGSFVARMYLMAYGKELDGAIIMGSGNQPTAALVAGRVIASIIMKAKGSHHRSKLLTTMAFGAYNKKIKKPRTNVDWLTKDEEIVDKYLATPADTFMFTAAGFKMLFEMLSVIKRPRNIAKIPKELPILVIAGAEDPVGNYGKSVKTVADGFEDAGIEKVDFVLCENDRHEILNETDREEWYEFIVNWIVEVLSEEI